MRALFGRSNWLSHSEWVANLFWAILGIIVLGLFAPKFVVGDDKNVVWRTDYESALQEAEQKKLPLLLHFYGDWCIPCKKMDQTVFASATVKDTIANRFIGAKLNTEKYQRLIQRYNIDVVPADLVIDPVSGQVLKIHTGLMDQSQYTTMLNQTEATFRKLYPAPPKLVAADVSKVVIPELGEPHYVVGLDGYSPVKLVKSRKWERGSAANAWEHKGVTYHMSSREELVEFRKNPELYAPKLLGCDPVILWQTDRAVAGSVEFGAFYNDDLYLFKTDERRKQFKANPEKYTQLRHALKASEIERTAMR